MAASIEDRVFYFLKVPFGGSSIGIFRISLLLLLHTATDGGSTIGEGLLLERGLLLTRGR